jgi:hypothetical protein
MRIIRRFGEWEYSYELMGAKGGLQLHVSGPHVFDGGEHWSAGLELHGRAPLYGNDAPSHDNCWLLNCPCWHEGTSLHAQEHYLPHVLTGAHDFVFASMVRRADEQWPFSEGKP